MTSIRQDAIHFSVREFLRNAGWQLVAGQFPNGSDVELPPLNVVDPALARDNSPDPRRHSMNKYVPDLVACKQKIMLLIEMDSHYSPKDERKLEKLLLERRSDLLTALGDLVSKRGVVLPVPIDQFVFVPCLGFGPPMRYKRNPGFCYFKVSALSSVIFEGNEQIRFI